MTEFKEFPKIPRLTREIIISEKIDGTNGVICITEEGEMQVGSRTKWITPEDDNHGFAKWCKENKEELMKLGIGTHHGEWMGQGIQRNYGLKEKRFYLFNTSKWNEDTKPKCCHVVPILYQGEFDTNAINNTIYKLQCEGSQAVKGFKKPEGIVIYHTAGNLYFKKTIEHDDEPKSRVKQ